jgi:hypothetical protein
MSFLFSIFFQFIIFYYENMCGLNEGSIKISRFNVHILITLNNIYLIMIMIVLCAVCNFQTTIIT